MSKNLTVSVFLSVEQNGKEVFLVLGFLEGFFFEELTSKKMEN